MGANAAENTNLRLKAVLDVLAEGVWSGEKLNAGVVLGEAIARVPLNDHERELLSGGIPRGHKALTSATAKLVKAGWLVKGRSGWTITEDGQRATVAFADPVDFNVLLGAPANWAPQYDESQMQLDEVDQLWKLAADLPAGSYSFKIAINRSWDENYGAFGVFDGANHEVHHRGGMLVIRYDHRTRDIVFG